MNLANFAPDGQDPQRPSGPCEVGGHPARATFDRSGPQAKLTVQFVANGEAVPLPPDAVDCEQLHVLGTAVPVRPVNLGDGTEALRGLIDSGLASRMASRPPAAASQAAPETPAPEAGASDLVLLSKRYDEARTRQAERAEGVKRMRAERNELATKMAAIDDELAAACDADAAHADDCVALRQQIRDLLDAEED